MSPTNNVEKDRPAKPSSIEVKVEVVCAALPFLWLLAQANLRALFAICIYAIYDGVRSSLLLIPQDPATIITAFGAFARVVLLLAPLARAFIHSPRHRLVWIPLCFVIWLGVLGTSVAAFSGILMWMLLLGAAAIAWIVAIRPNFFIAAFLPWLIALEPMLGHSPLGDTYWSKSRLAERCATNDGIRAVDMSADYAIARYFGVTPASPNLVLVTGERRSFWVRRDENGTAHLGPPLPISGNMWQGCVRDDLAWLTHRQFIWEVPVPKNDGPAPEGTRHDVPGSADLPVELDYVDTICPAKKQSVYSSQLVRGGFLEFDKSNNSTRFHRVIDGLNLQIVERSDGQLIGITTGRLVVFDPRTDQVIQEQAAGTVAMGIDICRVDNAIVISDFVGRVRIFNMTPDGRYAFSHGGFARGARRVSFSPDCSKIAVTSGNDRNLFILKRADLATERTYSLGPGLRDIVFLDNQWVAAADACVVNFVDSTR